MLVLFFLLWVWRPQRSSLTATPLPYPSLFRSYARSVISASDGDRGRRLSVAAGAVRGLLPSAVTDQEPPHSGARFDRRGYACAFAHGHLAGRQLAGARSLRRVRCAVRESSRSASHTDRKSTRLNSSH